MLEPQGHVEHYGFYLLQNLVKGVVFTEIDIFLLRFCCKICVRETEFYLSWPLKMDLKFRWVWNVYFSNFRHKSGPFWNVFLGLDYVDQRDLIEVKIEISKNRGRKFLSLTCWRSILLGIWAFWRLEIRYLPSSRATYVFLKTLMTQFLAAYSLKITKSLTWTS